MLYKRERESEREREREREREKERETSDMEIYCWLSFTLNYVQVLLRDCIIEQYIFLVFSLKLFSIEI